MSKEVTLQVVTRENWLEAIDLQVLEEQKEFTPAVAVSLARVYIKPDGAGVTYVPYAVYDGETMVGFAMFAYEVEAGQYWINGVLVDAKHQGRGYGKAAMRAMMERIVGEYPQCKGINLTVHKENPRAQGLYRSLGFEPTGQVFGEAEVVYRWPREKGGV